VHREEKVDKALALDSQWTPVRRRFQNERAFIPDFVEFVHNVLIGFPFGNQSRFIVGQRNPCI
jgi:hypothetical protein